MSASVHLGQDNSSPTGSPHNRDLNPLLRKQAQEWACPIICWKYSHQFAAKHEFEQWVLTLIKPHEQKEYGKWFRRKSTISDLHKINGHQICRTIDNNLEYDANCDNVSEKGQ